MTKLELYEHQNVAIQKITNAWNTSDGFSLNDDMGLGKTIAALAAVKEYFTGGIKVLVLCPNAVVSHWVNEITLVFDGTDCLIHEHIGTGRNENLKEMTDDFAEVNIAISTYHSPGKDLDQMWMGYDYTDPDISRYDLREKYAPLYNIDWDCLIIDESHTLRNGATGMFQSIQVLRRNKTLLLTGTPFNNNAMDMATQCILMNVPMPLSIPTNELVLTSRFMPTIERYIGSSFLNWSFEFNGNEIFRRSIGDKKYSLVPFNKLLNSNITVIKTLEESNYSVIGLHDINKNFDKYWEEFRSARATNKVYVNERYQKLQKDIQELKNFLSSHYYSNTLDQIKNVKKFSISQRILRFMMRFEKSEKMYETLMNDDTNVLPSLFETCYRKAQVMQWRSFWHSLTIHTNNVGFYEISNYIKKNYTLRRTKQDVQEIFSKIPEMEVSETHIPVTKEIEEVNNDIEAYFLEAWVKFIESKHIYGDKSIDSTKLLCIIANWKSLLLAPIIRFAQVPMCSKTVYDKKTEKDKSVQYTYKQILMKRFSDMETGTNLNQLMTDFLQSKGLHVLNCENLTDGVVAPISPKIKYIMKYADTCIKTGEKAVIFSDSTTFLMLIREHIIEKGCLLLTGSQTMSARNRIVETFKSDDEIPILLASIKACGVGLNLVCAQHVLFCEPSWNIIGVESQAMMRIHRIGQNKDTFAMYLTCTKRNGGFTIDTFMRMLQNRKLLEAKDILGDNYLSKHHHSRITNADKSKLGKLAEIIRRNR
jgi:superfamily II DNA or RNA helicase